MRYAFDYVPVEQAVQEPAPPPLSLKLTGREVILLTFGLPPVLLVVWLCAIQHNFQRGAAAVRYAAGLGPAAGRPLFLAGSAAGFVLILGVTIIGGPATAAGVLSQPQIWVLILLPDAAWAAPMVLVCILLPLREVCVRLPVRQSPRRRGAFE